MIKIHSIARYTQINSMEMTQKELQDEAKDRNWSRIDSEIMFCGELKIDWSF